MKTQETTIKVLSKDIKTGNTNGRDWEIVEYTIIEEMEREDGSIAETKLRASTTGGVGELDVGGIYKVVIFITSRETEKDGKTNIWNSFRITRAEKIGGEEPKAEEKQEESVADDLPF